jgi:hypothetical protein
MSGSEQKNKMERGQIPAILVAIVLACWVFASSALPVRPVSSSEGEPHLILKTFRSDERANMTLRDFLLDSSGYYLGMAPSFFGFYGYFGALAAWEDELSNSTFDVLQDNINGVAGASSGAMAAILLAAGIRPRRAAEFCTTIDLPDFADFPGLLTIFRGNRFEKIMHDFMKSELPDSSLDLVDAQIPVAVSGFDLQRMEGRLLSRGNMARAARASACFPFLFQPVGWIDGDENFLFVDGGITDQFGLAGLAALHGPPRHRRAHYQDDTSLQRRVINMFVGDFWGASSPGPSQLPEGVNATELLTITIQNLPPCGPHKMPNGPKAVETARQAMRASLDFPLFLGEESGHYELHIDASHFISQV